MRRPIASIAAITPSAWTIVATVEAPAEVAAAAGAAGAAGVAAGAAVADSRSCRLAASACVSVWICVKVEAASRETTRSVTWRCPVSVLRYPSTIESLRATKRCQPVVIVDSVARSVSLSWSAGIFARSASTAAAAVRYPR